MITLSSLPFSPGRSAARPALLPGLLTLLLTMVGGCGTYRVMPAPPTVVTRATPGQIARGEVVPHSYVVAFKTKKRPLSLTFSSFLAESRFHHDYLDRSFLADPRIKSMRYIDTLDLSNPGDDVWTSELAPPPTLQLAWDQGHFETNLASITEVVFHDEQGGFSLMSEWVEGGDIWFAEPNYNNELFGIFGNAATEYEPLATWWHTQVNLLAAFNAMEAREVPPYPDDANIVAPVIAVLDSGLDVDHPGLAPERVWQNTAPGQADCGTDLNGCDTTKAEKGTLGVGNVTPFGFQPGVGCPGGPPPVTPPVPKTRSTCKHGTHIAGIIAGKMGQGVGGICPVCKIMAIKVIADSGKAPDTAILNGLKYILRFKKQGSDSKLVRIVNASFGKYTRARAVALVVAALKKSPNEVLVVGAASNEDSMVRAYPAALNDAVAVAATGLDGQKAPYSNFGPWVDISAPGGNSRQSLEGVIVSTIPDDGQEASEGTSMAAPVVAGVAGLALGIDPKRSWQNLRDSIIKGANCTTLYAANTINRNYYFPKVGGEATPRPLLGSGMLDAEKTVMSVKGNWCPFQGLDRVNRGCSVVAAKGGSAPTGLWMILLFLPVAFASVSSLRPVFRVVTGVLGRFS